jgi:hypothetical protein
MAGDARVSFRDAAGRESEAGLALVSAEVLAAGRPWRVFRWRQGQAHYSGNGVLVLAPPGDLPVTNPQHADERGRRSASGSCTSPRGCDRRNRPRS